jgi:hypothetical protein
MPGIRPSDESRQLEVEMIYDSGDLENLSISGTIDGSLILEDGFADTETILEDLVGYWRMDRNIAGNGGQVHDYSGYGFEGVTRGGLESGASGFSSNNAFRFDGSGDYIELTDTPNIFSGSDDFTIVAWANHRTVNTGTPQQIITPSPDNQFELCEDGNGEVIFGWWDGSTFRHGLDFPVTADNWYQVAVTWDADNNVTIYKNGSSEDSVATDSTPTLSTGLAAIGQKGSGSNFFDGRIGEVRIYNRSLSGPETNSIYNRYQ